MRVYLCELIVLNVLILLLMSTIVLKWLKHTGVDEPSQGSERMQDTGLKTQIDSSTIDGNLHEFVHLSTVVILRHKCQQFYESDKIIKKVIIKCLQ